MIDPGTRIGAVELITSDLNRSVRFYQAHLGFRVRKSEDRRAWLGAGGPDLLLLSASPSAPRVRGTTGLYHFAVLVPSREELARSLRRLVETDTVLQGAADHGVSEAIYLADPDGNGIEMYRDRPRDEWPIVDGRLRMGADPLDLEHLLSDKDDRTGTGLPGGTTIGHVHLHVSNLAAAERFYAEILGFNVTQRYGSSALFVAAGGYHHHVGLNTWAGVGAPPPPAGAIGLDHFVVHLPDAAALGDLVLRLERAQLPIERANGGVLVRDPASNAILLTSG